MMLVTSDKRDSEGVVPQRLVGSSGRRWRITICAFAETDADDALPDHATTSRNSSQRQAMRVAGLDEAVVA